MRHTLSVNATVERFPIYTAELLIAFLGIWGIYAQASVALKVDFEFLVSAVFVPIVAFLIASIWLWRTGSTADGGSKEPQNNSDSPQDLLAAKSIGVAVLLLLLAIEIYWKSYWLFWGTSTIYFAFLVWWLKPFRTSAIDAVTLRANGRDYLSLFIFALFSAGIVLFYNWPNPDDGYYLNAVASAIDHRFKPLLSFDGMHDNFDLPIHNIAQKLQTYELLVAMAADTTGISSWHLYYAVFPTLFALFMPIANWALIKRWAPDLAWIGVLVVLVLLVYWSEPGKTYGRWAFTRLFNGKAVYVSVVVPLTMYCTLDFISRPSTRSWLLLFLSQSAGIALVSSAAFVGPLCIGLTALASMRFSQRERLIGILLLVSLLPSLWSLLWSWWEVNTLGGLTSQGKDLGPYAVFGFGPRGTMTILCLLITPLAAYYAEIKGAEWLTRYVIVSVLILFFPLTSQFVSDFGAELLSWRMVWAVPAPAILATALIAASPLLRGNALSQIRLWPITLQAATVLFVLSFVFVGSSSIGLGDAFLGFAKPKVPPSNLMVANHVLERTDPTDLVLAPESISVPLAGMHGAPKLVVVRELYNRFMVLHWGPEEKEIRDKLLEFAMGSPSSESENEIVVEEIVARNIDLVVIRPVVSFHQTRVSALLQEHGYEKTDFGNYEIWSRRVES